MPDGLCWVSPGRQSTPARTLMSCPSTAGLGFHCGLEKMALKRSNSRFLDLCARMAAGADYLQSAVGPCVEPSEESSEWVIRRPWMQIRRRLRSAGPFSSTLPHTRKHGVSSAASKRAVAYKSWDPGFPSSPPKTSSASEGVHSFSELNDACSMDFFLFEAGWGGSRRNSAAVCWIPSALTSVDWRKHGSQIGSRRSLLDLLTYYAIPKQSQNNAQTCSVLKNLSGPFLRAE